MFKWTPAKIKKHVQSLVVVNRARGNLIRVYPAGKAGTALLRPGRIHRGCPTWSHPAPSRNGWSSDRTRSEQRSATTPAGSGRWTGSVHGGGGDGTICALPLFASHGALPGARRLATHGWEEKRRECLSRRRPAPPAPGCAVPAPLDFCCVRLDLTASSAPGSAFPSSSSSWMHLLLFVFVSGTPARACAPKN